MTWCSLNPELRGPRGHAKAERKENGKQTYIWAGQAEKWSLTSSLFFCFILALRAFTLRKTIFLHHLETDLQSLRYLYKCCPPMVPVTPLGDAPQRHCKHEWSSKGLLNKREREQSPSGPKLHQCLCSGRQRDACAESHDAA